MQTVLSGKIPAPSAPFSLQDPCLPFLCPAFFLCPVAFLSLPSRFSFSAQSLFFLCPVALLSLPQALSLPLPLRCPAFHLFFDFCHSDGVFSNLFCLFSSFVGFLGRFMPVSPSKSKKQAVLMEISPSKPQKFFKKWRNGGKSPPGFPAFSSREVFTCNYLIQTLTLYWI